jgi:pre-mRNA-splicing factor ATP-dependent RNA helicase DHX15/PRP43
MSGGTSRKRKLDIDTAESKSKISHSGIDKENGGKAVPKAHINRYTGRPFSQKFWQILEKRKTLPVWEYYTKFMDIIKANRSVVLVGETGSGKTTQVWSCDSHVMVM